LTGSRTPVLLLLLTALLLLAGVTVQGPSGPVSAQSRIPAGSAPAALTSQTLPSHVFGFRDFTRQSALDTEFLAVPDAKLAEQHLRVLTAAPHWASSPQDHETALYVAAHFKAAGLETEIVPYSVLLNKPVSILVEASNSEGRTIFTGPTREHPAAAANQPTSRPADPSPDDLSLLPGFNGSSPSGDVKAPVVYANYGRLRDFQQLAKLGVSLKGKIALVRYGGDFRGVKVYLAQQFGAKGVLIYSDPADNGARTGLTYPDGASRPDAAVQLGSVQFLPIYPGDPTTPGVASVPGLPASQRIPEGKLQYDLPSIPVTPLSSADAAPILRALGGPGVPREWQGGLHFPYHVGGSANPVTLHMRLVQDARLRTIWDVIGKIPGTADPGQWVVAGNHRDAWMYGASDPGSGTAAMLEAVHGLGVLLQHGWRPRRTIVIASWDAEEEGLIGSTEWVEQHSADLAHAVAYFNMDVAVSGPAFSAAAVPSLRQFLREIAREVASPIGGTVLDEWKSDEDRARRGAPSSGATTADPPTEEVVPIGDLGSGSDYTPFLQHAGVPSTDIGSDGPFGVYHTLYDDYDWFVRFADPTFAYTRQQARIFGLEILHMADADVLPYDYRVYAEEIHGYLDQARTRAANRGMSPDFSAALAADQRFAVAARAAHAAQARLPANPVSFDHALSAAEHALLIPAGLPRRPWYKHSIYAPGEFTGYEAVVIPGVNDAIEAQDSARAQAQLSALAQALDRATAALTSALQ
jgi:N-acetylated-alpha-linked acidic dipeptidase